MGRKFLLLSMMMFLFVIQIFAKEKPVKMIEEGKYQEAIKHYDRIIKEHPEWAEAHFGKGVALYKEKNVEEAAKEFEKSIAAKNDVQKSAAYYNLGNILLNSQKPDEALKFFRKSLELNPKDLEAKHNYELAQRMLQQQQQQQNQDQNNDNQDKKDQDKQKQDQKQDQKNQDKQKQDQKQDQNQQDQQNKDQEKKEEEKQQQQQNQDKQEDQKKQDQQPQPQEQQKEEQKKQEMKKQEAAQILNSLKQNQKDMMKKRVKVKTSGSQKEKDW